MSEHRPYHGIKRFVRGATVGGIIGLSFGLLYGSPPGRVAGFATGMACIGGFYETENYWPIVFLLLFLPLIPKEDRVVIFETPDFTVYRNLNSVQ